MRKNALITGITGQDGSYLAELLLEKGYTVYGLVRRVSTPSHENIAHIAGDIHFVPGDMTDETSLIRALEVSYPDEIYNLAAQSHVGISFNEPRLTMDINGIGVLRLLEALKITGLLYTVKLYQASTSELFGAVKGPQNEDTPMLPRSPYAISKLMAHHLVRHYREAYGLWGCCGILFNHESPRRGAEFVTRHIARGVARIKCGLQDHIELGNMSACRDWGYAPDYVRAMWLMLQEEVPEDLVIAIGETHSVREFFIQAAIAADLPLTDDILRMKENRKRPSDVPYLCGDAKRAREKLGWEPSVNFVEIVHIMVQEELKYAAQEREKQTGYQRQYQD